MQQGRRTERVQVYMKGGQRALLEKSITLLVTKSSLLRFCLKLYHKKRKLSVVNSSARVFLVPITPPFPFGHASCILFSANDPNRDD